MDQCRVKDVLPVWSKMPAELPNTHSLATTQTRITKRKFWMLAILLLLALSLLAGISQRLVNRSILRQVEGNLVGNLESKTIALTTWLQSQQRQVEQVVNASRTTELLLTWLDEAKAPSKISPPANDDQKKPNDELIAILDRTASSLGATRYFLSDRTGRIVLNSQPDFPGQRLPPFYHAYLMTLMRHQSTLVPPHQLEVPMLESGEPSSDEASMQPAVMCIMTTVRQGDQEAVGFLGYLLDASGAFSTLLNAGSEYSQLETYAVNSQAQLLSSSSFEESLRTAGLLKPGQPSSLNVLIRDPGTDFQKANFPLVPAAACPMTNAAAGIVAAASLSTDTVTAQMTDYRNYRGVPVVGVWRWLPDYKLGLVAEIPTSEAFSTVRNLGFALWGLIGLLAMSLAGTLFFARLSQAVFRRLGKVEKRLAKMGQYELLEKIGQGGMGEVYRAQHALLRRETAVKICQMGTNSPTANYRFQREVQAASQLNNPHTVRIFDYGQSETGTFFYAMELLHGLNLTGLIRQFGTLSDGRTIFILKQVCESLAEAHGLGLVHRDIKPSNVMIGRRGGIADFVKVLDFGLVRSFGTNRTVSLTLDGCIAGTPHYMSPEASQNPNEIDPRSDLYSLGCLAFHLLSGQPPFKGNNPLEICLKQVREQPPCIQDQTPIAMCESLSQLIMRCIAKSPSDRPQSALELILELEKIRPLHPWSRSDAELWWRNNAEVAQKVMVAGPDTQASMNTRTPS